MTLCVVNALNENGMILLLSLGHSHHCIYDSHVTVVTNVSDPVRVLLVMSSAASGSMSTSEQDTHMEHTHNTWHTRHTHDTHDTHNSHMSLLKFDFCVFDF